jgi:hypothetical protein
MTDKGRKARSVVVLADRAKKGSAAVKSIDSTPNSLSLDRRDRFPGVQNGGYAIVCKNIRRNFSENVVGSQVPKNST